MIAQAHVPYAHFHVPMPSPLLESDALPDDELSLAGVRIDDDGEPVLDARWHVASDLYD